MLSADDALAAMGLSDQPPQRKKRLIPLKEAPLEYPTNEPGLPSNGKEKKKIGRPRKGTEEPPIDINDVLSLIVDGLTYLKICATLKISRRRLLDCVALPANKNLVHEALRLSADTYAELGLKVLEELKDSADKGAIARVREIAQHYRWMAAKRCPERYGDRMEIDQKGSVTLNLRVVSSPVKALEHQVAQAIDITPKTNVINKLECQENGSVTVVDKK